MVSVWRDRCTGGPFGVKLVEAVDRIVSRGSRSMSRGRTQGGG